MRPDKHTPWVLGTIAVVIVFLLTPVPLIIIGSRLVHANWLDLSSADGINLFYNQ